MRTSVDNNEHITSYIQFRIFTILWSIACLFHMAYAVTFEDRLHYVLLTLTALYVIFKPGSVRGFILLILLQLYDVFYLMPGVNNHWLFTAFVNITILHALGFLILKNKSFNINKATWFETFAAVVRVEVIILYFFAVFHKLNSDFLEPEVSCATDLLVSQNMPFLPLSTTLFKLSAYFTILIETTIPILLLFRKTRIFGVMLGILFHSVLAYSSYNGYFDFSSMMFALFLLFTPWQFSDFVYRLLNKARLLFVVKEYTEKKLIIILAAVIIGLLTLHFTIKRFPDFSAFNLYIFWLTYNIVVIYLLMKYFTQQNVNSPTPSFLIAHRSLWILPVLVFFNGCSPYLGLKTENSFSMFSNLRTEGGVSNHYFIPASWQIFDFQKHYVKILSSSDPFLQSIADKKELMVLFHFNDYTNSRKPARVEYILAGRREVFDLNGKSTRAVEKPPYLLKKTLSFRQFSNGLQSCAH